MHDPDTLAFEIQWPWWGREALGRTYYPDLIQVWHHDPSGYDDIVCGWHYAPLTERQRAAAEELIDHEFDNLRSFFPDCGNDADEMKRRVRRIFQCAYRVDRPWWRHPKWHFWHWRINVIPLRNFKRWAFTRCANCGGRFKWGEAPISYKWNGDRPRWFRGERDKVHQGCATKRRIAGA